MQYAVVVPCEDLRQAPNSESGRGKRPEVPGKRLGAPRNVQAGGHCEQGACELDGIGVKLFDAQTRAKSQDCGVKEEDCTGEDYEDTGPPPVCIRLLQVPGLSKTAKYRVFPYDAGWVCHRTRRCREAVVQSAMRSAFESKAKEARQAIPQISCKTAASSAASNENELEEPSCLKSSKRVSTMRNISTNRCARSTPSSVTCMNPVSTPS